MIVVANRPKLRDRVATPYNLNMAPNKMVTYSHTSFHRYDDDDDDDHDDDDYIYTKSCSTQQCNAPCS